MKELHRASLKEIQFKAHKADSKQLGLKTQRQQLKVHKDRHQTTGFMAKMNCVTLILV